MKDLIARKEYATITDVKWLEGDKDNCIRVYCTQSPDLFNFQVRTFKGIGERNPGKPRHMIATVNLSISEVEEILAYMKSVNADSILQPNSTKPLDLIKGE